MPVNTSGISASTLNMSSSAGKVQSKDQSSLDKDAFLKLLATQAKTQDPMNPSDSTQQIAQLAQFSSLEQMMNVAKTSEKGNAIQMIGHDVTYADPQSGQAITGKVEQVTMTTSGPTLTINGVSGIALSAVGVVK
ncbi:MAG: hypothetical protein PGN13_15030 [Patulibacter minatonensis]